MNIPMPQYCTGGPGKNLQEPCLWSWKTFISKLYIDKIDLYISIFIPLLTFSAFMFSLSLNDEFHLTKLKVISGSETLSL